MGEVFLALSMSLDGYVAGPDDDVEPLHRWLFDGEAPDGIHPPALPDQAVMPDRAQVATGDPERWRG